MLKHFHISIYVMPMAFYVISYHHFSMCLCGSKKIEAMIIIKFFKPIIANLFETLFLSKKTHESFICSTRFSCYDGLFAHQ
jgi:hypothetical protein